MPDLESMTREIESIKAELAEKKAKAEAVKAAKDDKEREQLASQHAMQVAIKDHYAYQAKSGYVTPKLAQAYFKTLLPEDVSEAVAALVYDTGAKPEDYGYRLPAGYADRAKFAVDNAPDSFSAAQVRRVALGAMIEEPPQLPDDLLWADRAYMQTLLGNGPLKLTKAA